MDPGLRRSFADPSLGPRLFDLLDTVFPGLAERAQAAGALGFRWEDVSTPFVLLDGDTAVSHVGVIEMPLVLAGRRVPVGVIHGVATHPGFRGRGLFRRVMQAALHHCDARYETLVLCTAQPELYEPFGFRVVQEHVFTASVAPRRGSAGFRELRLDASDDLGRLRRLLAERAPVSDRVGVVETGVVFVFNELTRPLHYAEDLDVIASLEVDGGTLRLFDLVGRTLCPLAAVLERLATPVTRVNIYFSPDRLDVAARPSPHVLMDDPGAPGGEGRSVLAVRGAFAPEAQPFMLPRPARC